MSFSLREAEAWYGSDEAKALFAGLDARPPVSPPELPPVHDPFGMDWEWVFSDGAAVAPPAAEPQTVTPSRRQWWVLAGGLGTAAAVAVAFGLGLQMGQQPPPPEAKLGRLPAAAEVRRPSVAGGGDVPYYPKDESGRFRVSGDQVEVRVRAPFQGVARVLLVGASGTGTVLESSERVDANAERAIDLRVPKGEVLVSVFVVVAPTDPEEVLSAFTRDTPAVVRVRLPARLGERFPWYSMEELQIVRATPP